MKSTYLNDIINIKDSSERKIHLIVREKTTGINNIEYILGDITKDIKFNSYKNFEEGQIVSAVWKNGYINSVSVYEGEYELKDFMPHSQSDIESILSELEKATTETFKDEEVIRLNNYFFQIKSLSSYFLQELGDLVIIYMSVD